MHQDSAGRFIQIGDRVRFRGEIYTIDSFGKETGHGIEVNFVEKEIHTKEQPTEWSIDRIEL